MIGRVRVGIRPADGYINLYITEFDGSKTLLTLQTNGTFAFKGEEVPMEEYETIPQEFRSALEFAFPNLIIYTANIEEFEPDVPDFKFDAPVEILIPGDMIPHELVGVTVYQRASDGYFNATAMCKAAGKRMNHYTENDATKEFLHELEGSAGNPAHPIVITITTGPNAGRGTWVHPDVAIHLAQWCSAKFAVQVSRWVREWFTTGSTPQALKLPQTYAEALRALADTAEEAQQLKLENLAANQVIGETRAQLVNTEIKLETAEDRIEILLNKIALPKVSILIEEFCHNYGNLLGVTEGNLFKLLYRHKILRETDRGPIPYTTRTSHMHFDVSSKVFFNSKRGRMDVRTTTKLTPAGVAWLRDWLLQQGPRRAARVADAVSATQQGIRSGN